MHIIALVKNEEHVCCRYRMAALRPFLEKAGHHVEICPLADALSWLWGDLGKLAGADVVILQRKLLPAWQLRRLRRRVRQLVFDFDDAVFLRDSYAPGGLHNQRLLRRFVRTIKCADAVVAGNSFLARQTQGWIPADRINVIPTCLEPGRYEVAATTSSQAAALTQLVWIGSASTLRGMAQVRPLLEKLGREIPHLRLKIICDRSLSLRSMPVEFCRWSQETEVQELAAADVGVSWVPDDDWSRGKCGLKILQYMAAGLPVVANPVGVQAELVQHDATGYLASTPEQWHAAISCLAQAPGLRQRLGGAGREVVRKNYDVAQAANAWLKLLERLHTSNQAVVSQTRVCVSGQTECLSNGQGI